MNIFRIRLSVTAIIIKCLKELEKQYIYININMENVLNTYMQDGRHKEKNYEFVLN